MRRLKADAPAALLVALCAVVLAALLHTPTEGASVLRDPDARPAEAFVRPPAIPAPAAVEHPVTPAPATPPPPSTILPPSEPAASLEALYAGGTGDRVAPVEFWMRLAHCETHTDWDNPGRYAGGLGIYIGTWRQWGGLDFAASPADASIAEQIVVANRISTQGYRRPDGKLVEPVWFTGWGALPCAGRPRLVALDDPRAHLPEHAALAAR